MLNLDLNHRDGVKGPFLWTALGVAFDCQRVFAESSCQETRAESLENSINLDSLLWMRPCSLLRTRTSLCTISRLGS